MDASELRAGTLVLCKVGSFPPWPAVVFPQRFLRNDVYRKRKPNCVAVCFFNDPTYYWEHPRRLKPLNKEIIDQFLESVGAKDKDKDKDSNNLYNRQQDDLVEAYKQAGRYSDLRRFIKNRFKDENRLEDFNREVELNGDLMPNEDPFVTKLDPSTGSRHDLRRRRGSSSSGNGNGNSTSSTRGKKSVHRRSSSPTEYTSTGEAKGNGDTSGSDGVITAEEAKLDQEEVKALKSQQNSIHSHTELSNGTQGPTAKKHRARSGKLDRSRRIEISLLFRRRIQKNLIQRDTPPTAEDIKETHKLLSKIYENLDNEPPFFDIDALRQSKLHKLLKVISNSPDLEEFHPICKDILNRWADLIQMLKTEKMKAREQSKVQGDGAIVNGGDTTREVTR